MTTGIDPTSTSGTANGFVINLPDLSGGQGFGLNFDFGENPAQVAQDAYAFVSNSFANDLGFLQQSISGSQDFLSHQVAPIINADNAQILANSQMLPTIYDNLTAMGNSAIAAIQQNTAKALAASQAASQASIAASENASGGGGCFVTTCVCEWKGLPDDCAMLREFREFRDCYLIPNFPALVREYYEKAPAIVEAMEAAENFDEICAELYNNFMLPCLALIRHGHKRRAKEMYIAGVRRAEFLVTHATA